MGVAVEGSEKAISASETASLPEFYPWIGGGHYIEIFNKGKTAFDYSVKSSADYVIIHPNEGKVAEQERISISINWTKAPPKISHVPVIVSGPDGKVTVDLTVNNTAKTAGAFNEHNGYIAIESSHYQKAVATKQLSWMVIPGYGRTLAGVTPWPVTAKKAEPGANSPHLEYTVNLTDTGQIALQVYVSPTLDFKHKGGLFYAISVDSEQPQQVNITATVDSQDWQKAVSDNIRILTTKHYIAKPGIHTIKYWMVDPGVVLQKIVIDAGGLKPSYLGPPE
jgi:hypothetical protein